MSSFAPASRPDIAIFVSFSGQGGVERMIAHLCQGFRDAGKRVEVVVVRAEGEHFQRVPQDVPRVDLGVAHTWPALFPLARYLKRRRPAVLLAAKDRAGRVAVLARRLAGVDSRVVIRLGTHLTTALAGKTPLQRWARVAPMRRRYQAVDAVVAVSEGVAADVQSITRLPRNRIFVVRNPAIPLDLDALKQVPVDHPWLNAPGRPVVLGIGRLTKQKDFPTLVRAFAMLRRRLDARLLVLGDGADRQPLMDLAAQLGVGADVDFPGFQTNPYAWLAKADLFVLSSRWEGSPNVLTEALACGTRAVATDCPSGPHEILQGGAVAPLVPVGDAEALGDAMFRLLQSKPDPERLRAAVAHYSIPASTAGYLEVFDRVCASR